MKLEKIENSERKIEIFRKEVKGKENVKKNVHMPPENNYLAEINSSET